MHVKSSFKKKRLFKRGRKGKSVFCKLGEHLTNAAVETINADNGIVFAADGSDVFRHVGMACPAYADIRRGRVAKRKNKGINGSSDEFGEYWETVLGIKLDSRLFMVNDDYPELDNADEVHRRFQLVRDNGRSLVAANQPHFDQGSWGNLTPRLRVGCDEAVAKLLVGVNKTGEIHKNIRCAAFKYTGD